METIGVAAFQHANLPKPLVIPLGLKKIEAFAFSYTKMVSALDLSRHNSLTIIGNRAFEATNLHVILPLNMTYLPDGSFNAFGGTVDLPPNLETIGVAAFQHANLPKPLVIPLGLKKIERYAFSYTKMVSALDLSRNNSLTIIGSRAFEVANLHVILPSNFITLGSTSFELFKGSITLPTTLKTIEAYAFYNSGIKSIKLPAGLTSIGTSAFDGCTQLESIASCNPTPPQLGTYVFNRVNKTTAKLSVPESSIGKYKTADQWKELSNILAGGDCNITFNDPINAPNSYIFDINAGKGGLMIPVAKAYTMWKENEYFKTPIPNGKLDKLFVSVYWEDVKGLIRSAEVEQAVPIDNSKIKVMINKGKGKGNALIALHVGTNGNESDPVYWSWHVWVTDDPTKGLTYKNQNSLGVGLENTFMDRNLGANSNSFLGYEWNKAGGLLCQWGRKDPFPPVRFLDLTYATIHTAKFNKVQTDEFNRTRIVKITDILNNNEVNKTIQYAVANPYTFINNTKSKGGNYYPWFSSNDYKTRTENYDLWGDNNKGKTDVVSYIPQLKSPFDPCPSGWRVPSYDGATSYYQPSSPWGNKNATGEVLGLDLSKFPGIKAYPGLGYDFKDVSGYYLGKYPMTGQYEHHMDENIIFADNGSESTIWGATLNGSKYWDETTSLGRFFHLTTDIWGTNHAVNPVQATSATMGAAVRCATDTRMVEIGTFATEYVDATFNYTTGLDNPNSYLINGETSISIPVNKAYAVYNQYLADDNLADDKKWPSGTLSTNVYWTTNNKLIKNVKLIGTGAEARIDVILGDNKPKGNAVISLHIGDGNSNDPVLWSWHIWAPESNPTTNKTVHITERSTRGDFRAYITKSKFPPLTTTFMDRNLGALQYDLASNDTAIYRKTGGMQYQWGRKDPIPPFVDMGYGLYEIYAGTGTTASGNPTYKPERIKEATHIASYAKLMDFNVTKTTKDAIKKVTENPLTYFYTVNKSWLPEIVPALWGHATKKSVFDPCPQGWRVPDIALLDLPGSPWYKEGSGKPFYNGNYHLPFNNGDNIKEVYGGKVVTIPNTNPPFRKGVIFGEDETYNLGQIPLTGFREGTSANTSLIKGTGWYTGLWSSAMSGIGGDGGQNALALSISVTNTDANLHPLQTMPPKRSMPVRCAVDEPRFTEESIASTPGPSQAVSSLVKAKDIPKEVNLSESGVELYPNPNNGVFTIALGKFIQGNIQVVNMNGNLIYSKEFHNQSEIEVNIQSQPTGIYLIKIVSGKDEVKKKVIKK